MLNENKKNNLGRGLEALLGEMDMLETSPSKKESGNIISIDDIHVSPLQPRKDFDDKAIEALSLSIKEKGILQPLIVRESPNGYELIAGERRLRAAKEAGLKEVPVVIKKLNDAEVLEIALIENLLRENLSPIEEAEAYQKLIDTFSHTQEKVADIVGKSRSYITNTMRLLSLPEKVKNYVSEGKLSAGHARCLVGLDNALNLSDKIIKEDLNVRQVEALVAKQKNKSSEHLEHNKKAKTDKDVAAIEEMLKNNLGLRIKISPNSQGGGKVVLQYASIAELDMIINILDNKKTLNLTPQNSVFKDEVVEKTANDRFSIKFVE